MRSKSVPPNRTHESSARPRRASMRRRWLRRRGRSAPRRSRIAARWVAIWPTPRPPDTLPVLLAYDAVVVTDRRAIPIDQFFTGYRKTALQPDELITAVRFPLERHVVF